MHAETRTPAPLVVEGMAHDDSSIWFSRGGVESYATPDELARLRRFVAHTGLVTHDGIPLDESDVTLLIKAIDTPQPLYPRESCGYCDRDATAKREGDSFFCGSHLSALAHAEDGAA